MIVVNIIKMRYFFLLLILFFSFEKNSWGENIVSEFLVAMPHMPDPRFKETVIFMLYHNQEEGAAGLVVNKPIEIIPISKLFRGSNITPPTKMIKKNITLHWGGPVQPEHIFFIHSSNWLIVKIV